MSQKLLKVISDAHDLLGIAYGFMEYAGDPIVYPYSVGEYTESEPMNEDGMQESTFLLNLFHRGSWEDLEDAKDRLKTYFNIISGRKVIADDGSAVAVFYANTVVVPTGDAELKRMQISLNCKEWSVI